MNLLNEVSLPAVCAGYIKNDGTPFFQGKGTLEQTGTGVWALVLDEPLPEGQYIALTGLNCGPISTAKVIVYGGGNPDDRHFFLITYVNDVAADINFSFAFYKLPPNQEVAD